MTAANLPDPVPIAWVVAPGDTLVGRDDELRALRGALAAALTGRGSLVLVAGEAGIGKTALAEALLADAAGRGALILIGHCYDLADTPPHGPWIEAFARPSRRADLPSPPDLAGGSVASQAALFAAVRDHLAALAVHQPVVLLLEDLHWADLASLEILRVLGRVLPALSVLLLATYRADELADDHPLATLLPLLTREARATRLDLRALDLAAIDALVAARYAPTQAEGMRLARYLAGRTEGNALFVGELLRALEGEGVIRRAGDSWVVGDLVATRVPPLLRQTIAGRLARLAPETRRLLGIAAVIGQEVPLTIWGATSGVAEDTLLDHTEPALQARLLAEMADSSGVQFVHALIREALYAGIPGPRRRALHRQIGEALAAAARPDPDAVAYHLRRAGDARAIEWLARAGERAQRAWAYAAAAARFADAGALADRADGGAREAGWLHYRLGVLALTTDATRALASLDAASRQGEAVGDAALVAYARYFRGMASLDDADVRRGVAAGLAELAAGVAAIEALADRGPIRLAALGEFVAAPSVYDEHNPRGALVLYLAQAGHHAAACVRGEENVATLSPEMVGMDRAAYGDAFFGLALGYAALGRPDEARRAFAQARDAYAAIDHQ